MTRPITPVDLWSLRRVGVPALARSGRFAVVPVTRYDVEANEGRSVLYRVAPGEAAVALTDPDASSNAPAISPDEKTLAFVRKGRKGEHADRAQLHVLSLDGGEADGSRIFRRGVTTRGSFRTASA